MFKKRVSARILLLVLLAACAPAGAPPASAPYPEPTATSTMPDPGDNLTGLIAYTSDQDGDFEIWVMKADGSDPTKLTDNDAMDISPAWSPDGTRIAFISNRDGNDEIYVMDADGSDLRRLTFSRDASESFPAWSPDGSRISFDSDRDGDWNIYVMESGGSDPQRLTDSPEDDWISSWSPDGERIAFESMRDGNYEIYVMDPDGGNQQRLTINQAHDGFPAWSPGGTQIAFMSQRDGNYEIYTMDADGSNQQRVTDDPAEDSAPAWSPDGEWLAFVSQRGGNEEIHLMKINGSNLQQLTGNGARNWSPAWQPQGEPDSPGDTWVRTFEGPDYGAFLDILQTQDGNILAVGATNHLHVGPYSGDVLIMKLSLAGEVLWEETWGGEGYEQAIAAVAAEDGGYYLFGETDSYGAGGRDFFLLKTSEDGSEEWFKTYGGTGREWPYGMLRLLNGDLLVYGFTESTVGGRDEYAIRLAQDGGILWEYTLQNAGEELLLDALETPEGDLLFTAVVEQDGKLLSLDADGTLNWARRYELTGWQYASRIEQTDDGGFLLAGFSMSPSPRQADAWFAGCSPTGELLWETSFGDASFDDYATSMIRLQDGTSLIGAISNSLLLSRIEEDGSILWRQSLLEQETVYGVMALIELEDGGFLAAGLIQLINGRSYDAIVVRTDSEGRLGE